MICALIIAFTINTTQITETSNRIDVLMTSAITTPSKDYSKDIEYIRSIIRYIEKNNTAKDVNSAKISTIMSLYDQILYEIELYQQTKDERLIKSIITNKMFADNILNTINKD